MRVPQFLALLTDVIIVHVWISGFDTGMVMLAVENEGIGGPRDLGRASRIAAALDRGWLIVLDGTHVKHPGFAFQKKFVAL